MDISLKDGYAVHVADIAGATSQNPVQLRLVGSVAAGHGFEGRLLPGTAVRILSGAPIPHGGEAIVSDEYARDDGYLVLVSGDAAPGRNILRQGSDVHLGQCPVPQGVRLRPAQVGLLAAAGFVEVNVMRLPHVVILATGDEIVAPGRHLPKGKVYASNNVPAPKRRQ